MILLIKFLLIGFNIPAYLVGGHQLRNLPSVSSVHDLSSAKFDKFSDDAYSPGLEQEDQDSQHQSIGSNSRAENVSQSWAWHSEEISLEPVDKHPSKARNCQWLNSQRIGDVDVQVYNGQWLKSNHQLSNGASHVPYFHIAQPVPGVLCSLVDMVSDNDAASVWFKLRNETGLDTKCRQTGPCIESEDHWTSISLRTSRSNVVTRDSGSSEIVTFNIEPFIASAVDYDVTPFLLVVVLQYPSTTSTQIRNNAVPGTASVGAPSQQLMGQATPSGIETSAKYTNSLRRLKRFAHSGPVERLSCSGSCCLNSIHMESGDLANTLSRHGMKLISIDGHTTHFNYRFCSGRCNVSRCVGLSDNSGRIKSPWLMAKSGAGCCLPTRLHISIVILQGKNSTLKIPLRLGADSCGCHYI